jgi:hypothetical protein
MSRGEILERHGLFDVEYEIEPTNALFGGLWMIAFHSVGNPLLIMTNPTQLSDELRVFGHAAMADKIDGAIAKVASYSRAAIQ